MLLPSILKLELEASVPIVVLTAEVLLWAQYLQLAVEEGVATEAVVRRDHQVIYFSDPEYSAILSFNVIHYLL